MKGPGISRDEAQRLQTLRALGILDTPPEERFDRFTRLARRIFNVPIALVSLVDADRQWFKSRQGLAAAQTSREISFCGHTILSDTPLVVSDTLCDERFCDNPLVTGDPQIRFYTGHPLRAPDGSTLGTVCLIGREPRTITINELEILRDLTLMVEGEFEALLASRTDPGTGLSNRRGFELLAGLALSVCDRTKQPVTLLYLDLDGFKQINDKLGHGAGDAALKTFAGVLIETFRDSDVVARMGGDEFAILLTGAAAGEATAATQRLQREVQRVNDRGDAPYQLRFSVGAVAFDASSHEDLAGLVNAADAVMYEQKHERSSLAQAPQLHEEDKT